MASEYGEGSIQVLEGLEAVRKRPGMYIGDVHDGSGLHHLVWEVVDNAVDEHLAGHCNAVDVTVHFDGSVTVEDDGRGIPVGIMHDRGVSAAEVVMTVLHAGGKFDNVELQGQRRPARRRRQRRQRRQRVAASSRSSARARSGSRSTAAARRSRAARRRSARPTRPAPRSRFKPDTRSSPITEYSYDILASRLRELAFLNAGLVDPPRATSAATVASETYEYKGGIREFVALLNKTKEPVHDDVIALHRRVPSTEGKRADRRRGRDAVDRRLHRADLLLHEQRPQQGRRHAPHRLARRAHHDAQHLRQRAEPVQGAEERPQRRGRARGR